MRGEEEEEESVCVYGDSGSVSFCSQGGVSLLFFALTHPHPSPATGSTTTRFYEAAAVVAEKDCSENRVHMCVCLRNVKMSFSQHQRPAHHREVERGVFSFQVENREKRKNYFLCVWLVLASFHRNVYNKIALLYITWETREKMGVIRCVNK